MKLCLVKVVLMLIITSYKGMVDVESIRIMCTYEYSVSHDRQAPHWGMYRISWIRDDSATAKTCWDYCNQDVACRSVVYTIYRDGRRWCEKYSISIQQLKDTGRDDEIYNETDTDWRPTYITYDRDCVNATSNTTLTTSPTTTTVLPGAMCIYPVSHDRQAPEWEFYRIDDDFLRDDNATKVTCWNYCNQDVKCWSALHIIHDDGRRYCYRFNITVQELKDSERYIDIYTETDTNFTPTYTTYDRDCGVCRYPVSHDWKDPTLNYRIDWICDDTTTTKTCQDWCNKDGNCRSVTYRVWQDSRYCIKYNISVQELKDTERDDEIYKWHFDVFITYDRDCAAPPSTTCSDTYSVSHEEEYPNRDMYRIDYMWHPIATPETCWHYCNQDVACRSVRYEIDSDGDRFCYKYSISVQQLKDTGRYNEIVNKDTGSLITYDKQCVESLHLMCNNEYPVSHDRQSPDLAYINWLIDPSATPKTCQDYCTKDVNCRSVTFRYRSYGRHYCYKYNISVEELKNTGRYNEIYTVTDSYWYRTFITYDRDCAELPGSTLCHPVSHDREWPNDDMYLIQYFIYNSATPETCQDWCIESVTCRSVRYTIYSDGDRWCEMYNISVQQLKDTGRYNEINANTNTDKYPTLITYDRECANCTYPVSHDRQSPATHLQIDYIRDDKATAKTCQDYCTKDWSCRSVLHEIFGGDNYCTKFTTSVQELKDNLRDNEIYNATFPTYRYITYDRDCVEVSPATKEPGTDGDEVSPATKGPGTNVAAIGEPMIVLILMIGAGAVFVAPMIPGAEVAF